MPEELQSHQLCCEGSLEAGEPLFATASRVDVWFLLEHNAAWGAKALPESALPDNLKTFLNHNLESIPNSRFQFIKQSSVMAGNPRFYIVRSAPDNPAVYEFRLALDELLNLDIPAVLAGSPQFHTNLYTASLFLVCTNGKRDLACARYGLPLYQAMSAHAGESVWQTTHLGGHRFAGTMAVLPEGLYYGRVAPDDAENLVIEHRAGRIYLDHFRGHSVYDSPTQAAEHFLREHTGNLDINALHLLNLESMGENQWTVQFAIGAETHTLQVSSYLSDFEIFESTANTEKNRITLYRLDTYEP
ncbi:MAG: sucrase ferredoxin [Chloroflexota bacterium]